MSYRRRLSAFRGRGFFVFSDPGGAKPVLALVEILGSKLSAYKIISDREYNFYDQFTVKVSKAQKTPSEELEGFSPDFVFTGTSYTSKIELEYLNAAKKLSIPTFAFVDHWTFIRGRFNHFGAEIFPDTVLVVDDEARKIAIEEGIEDRKLAILGNPYHTFLENWTPILQKEVFLNMLGLSPSDKKIVVFAPDPLSNIKGAEIYGFDEISATTELSEVIEATAKSCHFVVNPHPNQNIMTLKQALNGKAILAPSGIDVNTLIYYADVVIGFFSSFLIEASILKKPVLRYFPLIIDNDPFAGKGIGEIIYPETILCKLNQLI